MKWTKEAIIKQLQSMAVGGVVRGMRSKIGSTLSVVARRRFGSFEDACAAAGVMPMTNQWPAYQSGRKRREMREILPDVPVLSQQEIHERCEAIRSEWDEQRHMEARAPVELKRVRCVVDEGNTQGSH